MRIGVLLPSMDERGEPLTFTSLSEKASMVEEAGLDAIWKNQHLPVPGDVNRDYPDPLAYLLLAAEATENIELGSAVYLVGLLNPAEVAQRFYTMQSLAPGRFTFGVGTGSQELEYEVSGLDWENRFTRLRANMAYVRSVFEGRSDITVEKMFTREGRWRSAEEQPQDAVGPTLAMRVGRPRFALGAWRSRAQLTRCATEYDAWMGSAGPGTRFGGWKKVFGEAMQNYRAAGGRRAILATVQTDLRVPTRELSDEGTFNLACGPEAVAERINILEELGFTDVILMFMDFVDRTGLRCYTRDELELIRSLVPKDPTDYRTAGNLDAAPVPASPVST